MKKKHASPLAWDSLEGLGSNVPVQHYSLKPDQTTKETTFGIGCLSLVNE